MSKYSGFFLVGDAEYFELGEKLRLRRYGCWLTEEAWAREEQGRLRAKFSLRAIHLARRIANTKGISEEEAFEALQDESPDRVELLSEFSEESERLMSTMPSGRQQFEELVTLFFRNRGEVLQGKKWEPTTDWSTEDTKKLPATILKLVEKYMVEEDETIEDDNEPSKEAPKEQA